MSTGRAGQFGEPAGVEARGRLHLVGGRGAAVERPQHVVGERADGRGLVEDRGIGALEVVAQPSLGLGEAVAVEGERRGVSGRQLGRVQVPALVVAALQRPAHQLQVQLPAAAHRRRVADRQHVGRAVREPHPGAGRGRLHDELGVVGDRVRHALIPRGDPAERRVVVGAVVQRGAPPGGRVHHPRHERRAVRAQDRLRRFDLDLEAQPSRCRPRPRLARTGGPSPRPARRS